jgi:predicted dehydrogenase
VTDHLISDASPASRASDQSETGPPLRFGLVGTGYWARRAHARALAGAPGIEFAAVWGRNADAATALATEFGVTAHADFDAFLADVDGVEFSVPPDVQSGLATRAARAGKHLLLEKPLALTESAGEDLSTAIDAAGVASVVFFISKFQPEVRQWLAGLRDQGGWAGGESLWLGTAQAGDSPFNTPWRRQHGGLWDLGPHVVSLLWTCLGPVTSVTADRGKGDLTHLVLHHEGGASSTATLTLAAPEAADIFDLQLWGEHGRTSVPGLPADPAGPLRTALTELTANARSGERRHPCDAQFGLEVLRVLARAQEQLDRLSGSYFPPPG